ncbi:hypothetical protein [Desulfolithobacter sp.]
MKKVTRKTVITAILALGLATTGLAQAHYNSDSPTQPQARQVMMGPGMMGPGMMGPGMMNGFQHEGAWGMGCNPMMSGTAGMGMWSGLQQQFLDQTADLRKQMLEKRFEYMEAMRKPGTSPEDLAAIEKDMLDIRTKMMERMNSLQQR